MLDVVEASPKPPTKLKPRLRKAPLRQPLRVEQRWAGMPWRCRLHSTHPDYEVIVSFPFWPISTGARVVVEIGDDRARSADARARR